MRADRVVATAMPLVLGALMGLVTVLTLLSVAFYLAEWVRHMNATD